MTEIFRYLVFNNSMHHTQMDIIYSILYFQPLKATKKAGVR